MLLKIMLIYMNVKVVYKREFKGVFLLFYILYPRISYPGITIPPQGGITYPSIIY